MGVQRVCTTGLLALVVMGHFVSPAWAERLVVDDFDDGSLPNLLGLDYGAWNRYPDDDTQGCHGSVVASDATSGTGLALRLQYDVDSPNPAYCGFWSTLPALDLRPYRQLVLSLKGDDATGYTTQVKIELKHEQVNAEGEAEAGILTFGTGRYLLKGVTAAWQPFVIPLDAFEGFTDRSRVTELVILFDDMTSTKKVGTLYVDEIAFE